MTRSESLAPVRSGPAALLAGAWVALLVVLVSWAFWGRSYDDAFVTYRYGQNLLEHGQFAYNLGERVLGTTAPGYGMLLAALALMSPIGIAGWGTVVSVSSLVAVAATLRALLVPILGLMPSTGASVLLASAALSNRWNLELLGSEFFPLLALGVLASYLLLVTQRQWSSGLLVAVACCIRLDAALLGFVLAAACYLRSRRLPLRFLLAVAALLTPWLAWLAWRFGTFVPATLAGKQAETALASRSYFAAEAAWYVRSMGGMTVAALGVLGLVGIAWLTWQSRKGEANAEPAALAALGTWVVLHEIAYHGMGVPFAPWYHLYGVNALLAAAAFGVLGLCRWRCGWAGAVAAVAGVGLLVLPGCRFVLSHAGQPLDPRYGAYSQAAAVMRAACPRGNANFAAYEIGFLGSETGMYVVDLMGLVTPAASRARREGRLTDWLIEQAPLFLVDARVFPRRGFGVDFGDPKLRERYTLVASFADGRGRDLTIDVLRLRGGSC